MVKLGGYDFYRETLGSPQYVVAPMVEMSELAWRELSRAHGAQLCYTPMFHSVNFCLSANYRKDNFQVEFRYKIFTIQLGNDHTSSRYY